MKDLTAPPKSSAAGNSRSVSASPGLSSRKVAPRNDRDRFAALAFCWSDLVMQVDEKGVVVFGAGAFDAFTGRSQHEVVGMKLISLVVPEDQPLVAQCLRMVWNRGRIDGEVVRVARPHGLPLPMEMAGYTLDHHCYLALRMRARSAETALDAYSRDSVTGLLSPEAFTESASRRIRHMHQSGRKVGVSVVHMRDFDALRDRMDDMRTLGLLRSVGTSLRAVALDSDSATQIADGRYSLVHDAHADITTLERELSEIARIHDPEGKGVTVETAILDMAGAEAIGEEDLAKGLMYAMNQYKQVEGHGFSIRNLSTNISQLVAQGITEVAGFKQVVASGRFAVALQPIISAKTGKIHHYEALCRFRENRPHESPFRYISFAEETGMIHEFDLAMARKVLEWLSTKPRNSSEYKVALNISGFSIGMESYVKGLLSLLRQNEWARDKLLFEITESARMNDLEQANGFIQALRGLGYPVCLDDFGAGAASFQYLSALEVDVVKIDGSAISNAQKGPKGKAFLTALTELCRRLGVKTIAEMVDSPETLMFVRECGCDYVQGYLFGRPSLDIKDFHPLPHVNLFRRKDKTRAAVH